MNNHWHYCYRLSAELRQYLKEAGGGQWGILLRAAKFEHCGKFWPGSADICLSILGSFRLRTHPCSCERGWTSRYSGKQSPMNLYILNVLLLLSSIVIRCLLQNMLKLVDYVLQNTTSLATASTLEGFQCHNNAVFDLAWMPQHMNFVTVSGE